VTVSSINETQLLLPKRSAQHGTIALFKGWLAHVEFVWIHLSLDDIFSKLIGTPNEYHVVDRRIGLNGAS
jgi:hypothetical protein